MIPNQMNGPGLLGTPDTSDLERFITSSLQHYTKVNEGIQTGLAK
jgi:hypothetical protein